MTKAERETHAARVRARLAALPPRILRQKPNKLGYVELRLLNHPLFGTCRMYEHRFIIATELGRPLRREEQVHHINGDRGDNRRENLEYCASAADHLKNHRGRQCSPEVRRKISEAKRGKKRSEPVSAETRAKIAARQKARMADPANRRGISKAMKRYRQSIKETATT